MSVTHCLVNGADRGEVLFCVERHKREVDASHPGWNIIMVRKGTNDGLLSFAALVKARMGTPPSSLADEVATATALAATANEEAARTEAAAAESRKAVAIAAKAQALSDQARLKESLTEAHRLFERKFVAHRGAQSMHADDDAIAAKVVMVDEAQRCTILDESEYCTFDPASLPSVSIALQERKDAQVALREVVVAYKAALEATGTVDDDTGKLARAFSLPLPSPTRAAEEAEDGEYGADDRDRDSDDDATTSTMTTTNDATTTTTTTTTNGGTTVAMTEVPSPARAAEEAEEGESSAVVRDSASDDDANTTYNGGDDDERGDGGGDDGGPTELDRPAPPARPPVPVPSWQCT